MGSYGSLGPNYYTDRLLALKGASGVAPRKFGKAPAALSPNAGIPQSDTTDPDLSGLSPEDQQILNAMYPPGSEPQTIPSPGLNLGPLHIPGQALDQASLAMLNQLQSGPRAANFGQGLVAGLVQSRANAAMGRSNANAQALQQAHQDEIDKRKLAAQLLAAGRGDQVITDQKMADLLGRPLNSKVPPTIYTNALDILNRKPTAPSEAYVTLDTPDKQNAWLKANPGATLPPDNIVDRSSYNPKASTAQDQQSLELERQLRIQALQQLAMQKAQDALDRKDNIEQSAQGVADFSLTPDRVPRDKDFHAIENRANQLLATQGTQKQADGTPYNVRQLQQLKKQADQFYSTMDKQQMVGWRTSATTVRQHLEQFQQLFDKYSDRVPPANLRVIGMGRYEMALQGLLGQDAQTDAQALEPIAEALPLEVAKTVSGNRVPYEMEVQAAAGAKKAYVDPFLNSQAASAKLASTKRLIEARINSQMSALPYAGGKDNPYLLDVSPIKGWEDAAPQQQKVTAVPTAAKPGGFFDRNKPK